jgi:hypothetical protein
MDKKRKILSTAGAGLVSVTGQLTRRLRAVVFPVLNIRLKQRQPDVFAFVEEHPYRHADLYISR